MTDDFVALQTALRQQIEHIIVAVAELPDRTSPDDWPDAMLVTASELRGILEAALLPALEPTP